MNCLSQDTEFLHHGSCPQLISQVAYFWHSLISIPCIWKSPYCFIIPERLQGSGIPKMSQSIPDKHKVWVSSKLMEAWAALTKVLRAKGGRWEGSFPIQNLTHCLSKLQQSQVQNRQTTVLKTLTSTSKVEQLHEHTGLAWPREEFFWKEPKSCLLSQTKFPEKIHATSCLESKDRVAIVLGASTEIDLRCFSSHYAKFAKLSSLQ